MSVVELIKYELSGVYTMSSIDGIMAEQKPGSIVNIKITS